jgi:cell division protein FtsA
VPNDPYLTAIDIGSNSIKLAVVKDSLDEQNKIQVLALVERSSNGFRRGVITNMSDATDALVDTINQAESIIGLPIREGVVGVNGTSITFTNSDGVVIISNHDNEITDSDTQRVIQDSLNKAFGITNSEIIHVIPKSFSVDNQSGILYPQGMVGSKLEVKTLIISCEVSYLRNFSKVISQSEMDIVDRIFTPLASSNFILTQRQKKAGTALIDLGSTSTSFIVWENEEIVGSGVIPIGSDHITQDLAVGLQTNIEMAEEIKRVHLDLHEQLSDDQEHHTVEVFNPDLNINEQFSHGEILQYARPRVEEIFNYISKELRKMGKTSLPGGGVLIGGGAALNGLEDVAKTVLKQPIFKYIFDRKYVEFVPDYNDDPTFINAISLASYALIHTGEKNYNNFTAGNNSRSIALSSQNHSRSNQNSSNSGGFKEFLKKLLPWS